jgi:hypothetical protein
MHSIRNISERNKIDTQSRADAYIMRKRLISKSDFKVWMHPKVFLKLKKTLKTLSSGQMYKKNPKKPKKKPKNPKNPKKPTGLGFFVKKTRVFSIPDFFQGRPQFSPLRNPPMAAQMKMSQPMGASGRSPSR